MKENSSGLGNDDDFDSRAITERVGGYRYRRRRSSTPAYIHIANTLADRIAVGTYAPGDQLPTETQLRAEFGVSPNTVRRAIARLLEQGLVMTVRGKGTFVRSIGLGEAVFRLCELTDLWSTDDSVQALLLEASIIPASADVVEKLKCEVESSVIYMRRLISRSGTPLAYHVEHILYDERRPLVEAQLQATSLEGLLSSSASGFFPSGQLVIEAVALSSPETAHLEVEEGFPAFRLEHLFQDPGGTLVSWSVVYCRSDQFRLTSSIGIPSSGSMTLHQ